MVRNAARIKFNLDVGSLSGRSYVQRTVYERSTLLPDWVCGVRFYNVSWQLMGEDKMVVCAAKDIK